MSRVFYFKTKLRYVAPFINTIDIKDFHWQKSDKGWKLQSTPLGEGMVDFDAFFKLVRQLGVQVPYSLHLEYNLGGADKGAKKLTIRGDNVIEAMRHDLAYLRMKLSS